ncbi:MAG TPA: hypothetical protein VF824_18200 [Thermoanaerobaculia bacterium]|jgi:hypothetical protein
MLAAAALTLAIQLDLDLTGFLKKAEQAPSVTCGITTVGYRFSGVPGQEFRYAGDTYVIPGEGSIELIAERRKTTYHIADKSLPLDVWPLDQFGFRTVPLPSPETLKGAVK